VVNDNILLVCHSLSSPSENVGSVSKKGLITTCRQLPEINNLKFNNPLALRNAGATKQFYNEKVFIIRLPFALRMFGSKCKNQW
jgi:hypothetical protein